MEIRLVKAFHQWPVSLGVSCGQCDQALNQICPTCGP